MPRKCRVNTTRSEFFSPRAGIPRKRESQPWSSRSRSKKKHIFKTKIWMRCCTCCVWWFSWNNTCVVTIIQEGPLSTSFIFISKPADQYQYPALSLLEYGAPPLSPSFHSGLGKIKLYSPSAKKGKGRNSKISEVNLLCTCSIHLRVPEGSIWRLVDTSSLRSSRQGLSAHCASCPRYTRQFLRQENNSQSPEEPESRRITIRQNKGREFNLIGSMAGLSTYVSGVTG